MWFNSKKCYIPTKYLGGFEDYYSLADIKKLGKPKGKLVLDAPWSALGNTAYSAEALKILKKYHMNPNNYKALQKIKAINGSYHMEDGEVVGISCYKIDGKYYVSAAAIAELTDSRFEDTLYGWSIATTRPNKIDAYG